MDEFHEPLLGLVGSTLGIHPRNRYRILRTDDAHLLNLLVELLIGHQVSRFWISEIGFLLQFISLGSELRQVVLLLVYHPFRTLHHG